MLQRFFSLFRQQKGSPSGVDGAEERRVWVRYSSVARTTVLPVNNGGDTRLAGRVRNISRGGVNLIVRHNFHAGDMITVEIPCDKPEENETVLACVVHVNPLTDGHYSLGCEFSEPITEEDVEAFVSKKERPTGPEKREWARQPCNVRVTYQVVSDPEQRTCQAVVNNLSSGGIGLRVDQPIEAGTLLNLVLENGRGQARTILACVVHVLSRSGSERTLGCNFINELSEADFESLLGA
jgi:c-di-GMP-binding flagellar brake protein YcgR